MILAVADFALELWLPVGDGALDCIVVASVRVHVAVDGVVRQHPRLLRALVPVDIEERISKC